MLGSAFNISSNGLRVAQARLETVSNNIANAGTEGYHREVLVVGEMDVARYENRGEFGGMGAEVLAVNRLMDMGLAARIQNASANYNESSTQQKALNIAEQVFADQASQVSTTVQDFANSIGEVSKDPSSPAAREKMLGAGKNLAARMNDVVTGLKSTVNALQTQQTTTIEEVNQLSKQLAQTNSSMGYIYGPESYALKDRALLQARQLADKVGGTFKVEASGMFTFAMPNGKVLVDGDKTNPMEAGDLAAAGGQAAGRRQALERVSTYTESFKTLMSNMSTAFNTMHKQGVDMNGAAGGDFFAVDATSGELSVTVSDYKKIAASGGAGNMDNTNALKMEGFSNLKFANGGTATMKEAYSAIQTAIGTHVGTVEQDEAADEDTLTGLKNFQKQTEGVNEEQEGVELLKAKRQYEAMAQVLKTADSMLGTLLSIKS